MRKRSFLCRGSVARASLETLESRRLLAVAVLYYNPNNVETESFPGNAAAVAVKNALIARGHTVRTFTDFTPATLTSVLDGADFLVMPRIRRQIPVSEFPDAGKAVVQAFVNGGGGYLQVGDTDFNSAPTTIDNNDELLSGIFGFSTFSRKVLFGGSSFLNTAAAVGTTFETGQVPTYVNHQQITVGIKPATADVSITRSLYTSEDGYMAVGLFNYAGRFPIAYLAWDFLPGNSPGTWNAVLTKAIDQVRRADSLPGLGAPTDLAATAISSSQINLTWTDNATIETGFRVDRATNSTFTSDLVSTTLGANVVSLNATGLAPGTTYYFRVVALKDATTSFFSNTTHAMTAVAIPAAPTDLSATPLSAPFGAVHLAWTDNATDEASYRVDMASDANFAVGAQSFPLPLNSSSFDISNLNQGEQFYFRVFALGNGATISTSSNVVSTTTLGTLPAVPTSVTATALSSSEIRVDWVDNADNETACRVEMSTDPTLATNVQFAILPANSVTSGWRFLNPSTTYYFRVSATNALGSGASPIVSVTTPSAVPNTPNPIYAHAASDSVIKVSWKDTSTNETGFVLDVATDPAFTTVLKQITRPANYAYAEVTGLQPLTRYYFRVFAKNADGVSAAGAIASDKTQAGTVSIPAAPGPVYPHAQNFSRIDVSWKDNADNETGFVLEVATDAVFANVVQTIQRAANYTYAQVTGLTPATKYFFRVAAKNAGGNSTPSVVASATTAMAP